MYRKKTKTASPRRDVYQDVTDRIIAALESGTVPWRKPWRSQGGPTSFASKREYRGINWFLLGCAPYACPWWATWKQIHEKGGTVKAGEGAWPVTFWKWLEIDELDAQGKPKKIPFLRSYRVWNLEQTTVEWAPADVDHHEIEPIDEAEAIVEAMPDPPAIVTSNRAAYSPALDTVKMPRRDTFESSETWYATLFHELVHSTGHTKRLGRPGIEELAAFGSPVYSREELVAEMGAAFLCGHAGIDADTLPQSAAYIDNWLSVLRGDNRMVVTAAAQAQKAADYILAD